MNIYLIGFMGSGKSYWAKKLGKQLNREVFDMDNIIEDLECTTIDEVFYTKGETYFRQIENKVLKDLTKTNRNYIISCGGGTPCFFNNMQLMNQQGKTFYLKASVPYLLERLESEQNNRPLITTLNKPELKLFIEKTLAERSFFYNKATSIIDIENTSLPIFVQTIKQCINQP